MNYFKYIAIIFSVIFPVISLANCPLGKYGNCPGGEQIPPGAPIKDAQKMTTCPFQGLVTFSDIVQACAEFDPSTLVCLDVENNLGSITMHFLWVSNGVDGGFLTVGTMVAVTDSEGTITFPYQDYVYPSTSPNSYVHYCYGYSNDDGDIFFNRITLSKRSRSPCYNPKYGSNSASYGSPTQAFADKVPIIIGAFAASYFESVWPLSGYNYPDPNCVANMFNPAPPSGDDDDCENLRITINPPFYPSTVRVNCN